MLQPLQKQLLNVPLAGGVDVKGEPQLIAQQMNLQVNNGTFTTPGTISTRMGFAANGAANADTNPSTLFELNGELGTASWETLSTFGASASVGNEWQQMGTIGATQLSLTPVQDTNSLLVNDVFIHNDIIFEQTINTLTVRELSTNHILQVVNNGTAMLSTKTSTAVICFTGTQGSPTITTIPFSAPDTNTVVIPSGATPAIYPPSDAAYNGADTIWSVNYDPGLGIAYAGYTISTHTFAIYGTFDGTVANQSLQLEINASGVAFVCASDPSGTVSNFYLMEAGFSPTIKTKISYAGANWVTAAFIDGTATPLIHVYNINPTSVDTLALDTIQVTSPTTYVKTSQWNTRRLFGTGLCSFPFRPMILNDQSYVWVNVASITSQPRLVEFRQDNVLVGAALQGRAVLNLYGVNTRPGHTANGAGGTSQAYALCALQDFASNSTYSINRFVQSIAQRPTVVSDGYRSYTAGVLPCVYDTRQVYESGFLFAPEPGTPTVVAGGSLTGTQTYGYVFTYEYTDSLGHLHRSAPSIPVTATTTNVNKTVHIPINANGLTNRQDYRVVAYRTMYSVAGTVMGTVYQRVGVATAHGMVSTTFVDASADNLAAAEVYTTGGVLEAAAPDPLNYLTPWQGCLWGASQLISNQLWFTKKLTQGIAAEWNGDLTFDCDQALGPILGLAPLDDKLLVFQERGVSYITGTVPDDTGQNGAISGPFLLSGLTGLVSAASILRTDDGVWFQDQRGLALVTRGGAVTYTGATIERLLVGRTITGSCACPHLQQLHWYLDNGTALIYDTTVKQWSTYSNYQCDSGLVWQNTLNRIRGGQLLTDTPGLFTDQIQFGGDTVGINKTIETGWIKPAQSLMGYQRLYRVGVLGNYKSAHTLSLQVAFDYDPTVYVTQSVAWPITAVTQYQMRWQVQRQKAESFKFLITDNANSGEAYSLTALVLEFGMLPGLNRLPAAQSV